MKFPAVFLNSKGQFFVKLSDFIVKTRWAFSLQNQ